MMWPLNTTRSRIGIDLSGKCIRAVQLAGNGPDPRVQAVASIPRTDVEAPLAEHDARRLFDVLGRQSFTGIDLVVGIPDAMLGTAIIRTQRVGSALPRDRSIREEFAKSCALDPTGSEIAYWELPAPSRGDKTTDVMAVGCAHDDADALLAATERAGFRIAALDVACAAIARWLTCVPDRARMSAVLDLEWESAGVVVVYQEIVVYERSIAEAGLKALYHDIKSRTRLNDEMLDLLLRDVGLRSGETASAPPDGLISIQPAMTDHLDRMIDELKMALSYVEHQYQEDEIAEMHLIGEGARIVGLPEYLSERLDMNIRSTALAQIVTCPTALADLCASSAPAKALGYALHPG